MSNLTIHSRQFIEANARELAAQIREICASQIELWRKIPVLALEANGRTGFSGDLKRAYTHGAWNLVPGTGWPMICVDLGTGRLLFRFRPGSSTGDRLAHDKEIIGLAFELEKIDAGAIATRLRKQAAHEPDYSIHGGGLGIGWRQKIREELSRAVA